MSNRLKAGLNKAFAPLKTWATKQALNCFAAPQHASPEPTADLDALGSSALQPARINEREAMVTTQIAARGVRNQRVLKVMKSIPRHEFVPASILDHAYEDGAMPIGNGQTISQPYIVALMTEALDLTENDRVLEIGTGCGYQSAVLAALCRQVYSMEIVPTLAEETRHRLARLGIENVEIRIGDGYRGWPEQAPFDCIIITAAPDHIPEHLFSQLAEGGRLIIPVGQETQELLLFKLENGEMVTKRLIPVRFVPMTGEAMSRPRQRWGN